MMDGEALEKQVNDIILKSGLTIIHSHFHQFGKLGGVTGAVILAESHFAIHCWPEKSYITLDCFVCNYNQNNRQKALNVFLEVENLFQPRYTKSYILNRE